MGIESVAETYVTRETLDHELKAWLDETEPFRWRPVAPVTVDKMALLVVDVTKPFVDSQRPLATPNARAIIPRIQKLVHGFRVASRPIIWVVQGHHSVAHDRGKHLSSWWPQPLLEGTDDVDLAAGLQAESHEKVIVKRRYSGFYQTDLELTLRNLGIAQLVICGVLTNVCPYTTAFDAFLRDFEVYYPADGTASLNRELHVNALKNVAAWCGYVVAVKEITSQLQAHSIDPI